MAYKTQERKQNLLFPPSFDELIQQDDPVRIYDAFVDTIDLNEIGIEHNENKVGNSSYDPRSMLKLLVYGYSYNIRSSRKLERAVHHNISFIWLMGGLTPDHKTIAEFRRKNIDALKKVLHQSVKLCIKLDLIDSTALFVDGTKLRANAALKSNYSQELLNELLREADEKINLFLEDCARIDREENNSGSLVKMKGKLRNAFSRRKKIEQALEEIKKDTRERANIVDHESRTINSTHGSYPSYNAQCVTDGKHGLVVNTDILKDIRDCHALSAQIRQANETMSRKCKIACADKGYYNLEEFKKLESEGTISVVPTVNGMLPPEGFSYNQKEDCFVCPENRRLRFFYALDAGRRRYVITNKEHCRQCIRYKKCCGSDRGKTLTLNVDALRFDKIYRHEAGREIYKQRNHKVEKVFAHTRNNLGMRSFLLRGIRGVQGEFALAALCFNLRWV